MKIVVNLFIAVLTIISIGICYILSFCCINRYILECFVVLIPVIMLLRLRFLLYNNKIKNSIAIISMIGILIVFVVMVSCGVLYICLRDGTTEITNKEEYSRLLNLESKELVYYFPNKILKEHKEVQFYYIPQFLQGGMKMKLEFKASKEEIDSYIDKYKGDYIDIINLLEHTQDELKEFGIYSYGINLNEAREDVTIYLIISEPGNHGKLAFIAVNNEHTEILFQAERW